ncbi:MAG: SDR family oxidoreductase [Chlamydiae bacterium]|nr:SDR family oxidoreductase [Chlamydiota bacterium]
MLVYWILTTLLFPLFGFSQQVIVITGASRGVGYETAKLLAYEGNRVFGIVRQSSLKQCKDENIEFIAVDYEDETSIQDAIDYIFSKTARVDVLINNAGYALIGPVETLSERQIIEQMELNFLAPIRFTKAVLPKMRIHKSGRILNISPVNGISSQPFGAMYCASKAALESFSESLSLEILPHNIHVSILEPGPILNDFKLFLGETELESNPYKEVIAAISYELENRLKNPLFQQYGQTSLEIALKIREILQEKKPKLRYQTSDFAKLEVEWKLKDLDGELFLTKFQENS